MSRSPATFETHLHRLELWLASLRDEGRAVPSWNTVVAAEDEGATGTPQEPWIASGAFDRRFQQILHATTRSWVNVVAFEVRGGTLHVVVEYLTSPSPSRVPPELISVNLSCWPSVCGPLSTQRGRPVTSSVRSLARFFRRAV